MAEVTSPEVQKYSTLVKLQPENPEAHFRLGFAHDDAGNTAEAVKHYETAIKLQPRHAMSYLHRGFLFAKGGELQLALQEWAKAFEYDPYLHNKFSSPELRPIYKGKFDTAIQQLERPIVINPKDAFARYQLGTAYKYFQKPELALQSLKRALDINPDLWEAHFQCGEIFSQLGQNKLAINSFQRAIDGNSRYADSHYQLGLIYEKENMSALALRHVERAIELDPEVSKYHFALGRIFMKQTKYKRAMKQYQKALDLDPKDARIHLRLAECCKQMYRPDLAIHCYEKAVELDPDSSEAVYELGTTALQLGDIDRAITGFRKALEINPQDAYAHYSLAQAYHRQKDYEAAATHYGESARLNPKDAFAAYNLGLMRDELHQPQQAIEAYRKAVELKPLDAQYHLNLGRAYLNAKRPQEAASELKQAIKLNPNDLETNFFLADVHMEQKQFDEAINLYRKVVELNPSSVEARFRMAEAFKTLDMPDYAFEAFQETVRLDPRHHQALHGLGEIYLGSRKKPSIAVDFFQQALDVEPSFAPSMVSLGDAYMQLGQPDRALQFFERKLEENRDNAVFISKYCLALGNAGHGAKAGEEIRVALQLNPESVDLRRSQAALLEQQNRPQDALDAWRTAVRLDENDVESIFGYAKALQSSGQEDEAKANFQKILNLAPSHREAAERLAALMPYDPNAAPLPSAAPAAPVASPTESTDPFDFISPDSSPVADATPVSAPSEDPFAAAEPESVQPAVPVETPSADPFASDAPAETPAPAAEDPFASSAPAETPAPAAEDPFAAEAPAETPAPATEDPFATEAPAETPAPAAEDPFATEAPAETPAAPAAEDPFATEAPAEAPAPAAEDPFATEAPAEAPAPAAEDPFATEAPTETPAPAAEDPFATEAPAETPAPAAEDPFATEAPAEAPAPAAEDPFATEAPAETPVPSAEDPFATEAPAETPAPAAEDPFATEAPAETPAPAAEEPVATEAPAETPADPPAEAPAEESPAPEEVATETPSADPDFAPEEVLQQAILANVTGQGAEAETLFLSILEKSPDYAPVYFHYGQYIKTQGDADKSKDLFEQGLAKAQAQGNEELIKQLEGELSPAETEAPAEAAPAEAEAPPAEAAPAEAEAPAEAPPAEAAAEEAPVTEAADSLASQLSALTAAGSLDEAVALWEGSEDKPAQEGQDVFFALADSQCEQGGHVAAVATLEKFLGHHADHQDAIAKLVGIEVERATAMASESQFSAATELLTARVAQYTGNETLDASLLSIRRQHRDHALSESSDDALALARALAKGTEEDKAVYLGAVKTKAEAAATSDLEQAIGLVDGEVVQEDAPDGLLDVLVGVLWTQCESAKSAGDLDRAKEIAQKIVDRQAEHAGAKALLEAPAEEAAAWKTAEESGDLAAAVAAIPGDDEHEGDRHRLYAALVEKHKGEENWAEALTVSADWLGKVGDANKSAVNEVRRELYGKQIESASGADLLASFDGLKEAQEDSAAWSALVISTAKAKVGEAADDAQGLLLKLDAGSLEEASKTDALGVWLTLGQSYLESGDLEKADQAVTSAQTLGTSDELTSLQTSTLAAQAQAAKEAGDQEKTDALFAQLKELAPEHDAVKAHFAEAAPAADDGGGADVAALELPESPDEALELLKEKLSANPEDVAALKAAYATFGTKANARKLIDLFRELQKKNSDNPQYLLSLARAYSHVGKDTLAVVQFRKLLSNDPRPEVYLDLTRAYRRLKKMADASKTLEMALEAMPDNAGPKREQVVILSLSEEHSAAEAAAKEGLAMANISDDDKSWFEQAAELTGAGSALSDELLEIPSRY